MVGRQAYVEAPQRKKRPEGPRQVKMSREKKGARDLPYFSGEPSLSQILNVPGTVAPGRACMGMSGVAF